MSVPKVELWYAPLPFIGALAVHTWFVVHDAGARQRWEVWQRKNAGGTCVGHVHRDLKPPGEGVGGGPARVATEWNGDAARRIIEVLRRVEDYPYCQRYRLWPGPNSNTYVAWVLRAAGIDHRLHWKAFGRSYR